MSPTPARSETICDQMGHLLDPNGKCYRCGQFPPPPLAPATSLTPAQEALRALAEKATPGKWVLFSSNTVISVMTTEAERGNKREVVHWSGFDASHYPQDRRANAAYIAAANPAAVLALLDELAAARGALEKIAAFSMIGGSAALKLDQARAIARAHLVTPADLSLATEDFPLGRCHRCGEPIADQDKGNEGCEDPHCPTLP